MRLNMVEYKKDFNLNLYADVVTPYAYRTSNKGGNASPTRHHTELPRGMVTSITDTLLRDIDHGRCSVSSSTHETQMSSSIKSQFTESALDAQYDSDHPLYQWWVQF